MTNISRPARQGGPPSPFVSEWMRQTMVKAQRSVIDKVAPGDPLKL